MHHQIREANKKGAEKKRETTFQTINMFNIKCTIICVLFHSVNKTNDIVVLTATEEKTTTLLGKKKLAL